MRRGKWLALGVVAVGCAFAITYRLMPPEPKLEVVIGWTPLTYDLPYYVGVKRDVFRRHDLKVEGRHFGDSNLMAEALVRGDIDIATSVSVQALLSASGRSPGRFKVFALHWSTRNKPTDFVLVKKGSGIRTLGDLSGKRIGVHIGSTMRAYASAALRMAGVDPDSVDVEEIPPDVQQLRLQQGEIDALFAYDPYATAIILAGDSDILMAAPKNVIMDPMPSGAYAFSEAFIASRQELVPVVKDAFQSIFLEIRSHPKEAVECMRDFVELPDSVLTRLNQVDYSAYESKDVEALQKLANFFYDTKVIQNSVDVRAFLLDRVGVP